MKIKFKIATIAMILVSLGVNAQTTVSNIEYCNTLIANSYVKVVQISTKSNQLASNVRVSATSHTGNHVGNFTANILVNHYQDVFVKTISGAYTQGTIKIESDNNGSYIMSYKTTSSNAGRYYFTIEALSSEITINPIPTGQSSTNTVHEHKTNFGTHESGTGGDLKSFYEGDVGIGTTNTFGYKLAVNGTIGSTEVKVENTSAWPDFVFESDYELRTIEEVEEHIAEKGHLPEIPSEAEVTENGINLGEMDAKLLQKIEELTLYLIEQNKEIKELKEKVNRLENK